MSAGDRFLYVFAVLFQRVFIVGQSLFETPVQQTLDTCCSRSDHEETCRPRRISWPLALKLQSRIRFEPSDYCEIPQRRDSLKSSEISDLRREGKEEERVRIGADDREGTSETAGERNLILLFFTESKVLHL